MSTLPTGVSPASVPTPVISAPGPAAQVAQALPALTWLAPLGAGAAVPATFDATAAPVVEICALTGTACATSQPVARFATVPAAGSQPLTVNATAGRYEAAWNLLDARFTTRATYRIRVLQGGTVLGALSVDVVRGRWALTRSDGTLAPLTAATALPIQFHLARAGAPVIPATTKVLDANALASIRAVDARSVTFSAGAPVVAQLAVGDVIAAGISATTPYGLLRRVLEKQVSGTQVVVRTSFATVADAITRGEFHFTDIPLVQESAAPTQRRGAAAADASASFQLNLSEIELGNEVEVNVDYEGEISLSGDLVIDESRVKVLSFVAAARNTVSLSGEITEDAEGQATRVLKTWDNLRPITVPIAGVPIVLFPTVDLELSGAWEVEGGLSAGVDASYTARMGFRYENGSMQSILEDSHRFTPRPLGARLEAVFDASIGPVVKVTPFLPAVVLNSLGIQASAGFGLAVGLGAEVPYFTDPWWELSAGISASAEVDFALWDRVIAREQVETPAIEVTLAEGESELTVTPEALTVDAGTTTQAGASVRSKDALRVPLPLTPGRRVAEWASRDPSIATVAPASAAGATATISGGRAGRVWVVALTRKEPDLEDPSDTIEASDSVQVTVNGCESACTPPPPDPVAGNAGRSWGDPHLFTIDGRPYSFQAVGDYVVTRSTIPGDDFEVQERYVPLGTSASRGSGVAARVAGDVVNVFPNGSGFDVIVNGEETTGVGSLQRQLPGGGAVRVASGLAVVSWPDRSQLTVRSDNSGVRSGMQLLVANARMGKVEGLFGNYDGNTANDLRVRGGAQLGSDLNGLYGAFRNSWRVALGTPASLFRRGPDPWDPAFPREVRQLSDFSPSAVSGARATCRAAGVIHPASIDGCAFDLLITGNNAWAAIAAQFDPAIPRLSVSPALSYVTAGERLTLTAGVDGLTNRNVRWSATGGSVTTAGPNAATYTAPATPGEYTVTASSAQNAAVVSSARVVVRAPSPPGTAAGRLYVSGPGTPVAGATLRFTRATGAAVATVTSSGDGSWRAAIPQDVYTVRVEAPGVRSTTIRGLVVDGDVTVPAIPLALVGVTSGAIQVTVRDATTGRPLSGAVTLTVVDGAALTSSAVDAAGGATTVNVPPSGTTVLPSVPGTVTVRARAAGYADALTFAAPVAGQTVPVSLALVSNTAAVGQVRIVLSWGANPRDLDSYLTGPTSTGGAFTVYYGSRGNCTASPFACLDFDVTSGFGPETITIERQFRGVYRYSVDRYSGSGTIATSSARVDVYVSGQLARSFTPPPGDGDVWNVFELANGQITPINTYNAVMSTARRAPKAGTAAQARWK
jgi:hypothetical protein